MSDQSAPEGAPKPDLSRPVVYRALNAQEREGLEGALARASQMHPQKRPLNIDDIQTFYNVMVTRGRPASEVVDALGMAFGQTCIGYGGVEWARLSDPFGEETVIAAIGKRAHFAPITMFDSRLQMQVAVDWRLLRDDTMTSLRAMADMAQPR